MNLHNHTIFSDGKFSPEEIIKFAIKGEINYIGICDHYLSSKIHRSSLDEEKLKEYIKSIKRLSIIYSNDIKIFCGIEIDFSILRTNFVSLPYEQISNLDFVLFEYVSDKDAIGLDLPELVKIRDNFQTLVGLAHNDIEKNFGKDKFDELIDILEKNAIFLELCPSLRYSRGITPYYYFAEDFFRKVKGRDVLLSIGTDTHDDIRDVTKISNALDFLKSLSLEDNMHSLIRKLE